MAILLRSHKLKDSEVSKSISAIARCDAVQIIFQLI